jgi:hypothetical protein
MSEDEEPAAASGNRAGLPARVGAHEQRAGREKRGPTE